MAAEGSLADSDRSPPWDRRDGTALAVFGVLSFLYVLPLWLGGAWFVSHEMSHALVRLGEYDSALHGGQFPVRWSDNLMAGFGVPLFNFFPPLSFQIADFFHLAGAALESSWKLELTLARMFGAAAMYGLLRRRAGRIGAFLGALLFLFAHYHGVTLYRRGNLQEFTALNLWPAAFWGLESAIRSRNWLGNRGIAAAAFAVAAIGATHVLTAYMIGFQLAAWGVFLAAEMTWVEKRISWRRFVPPLLKGALIGSLGLAVAAFFVIPAALELKNCQSAVLTVGTRYDEHFLTWWQTFRPLGGYGLSVPGPDDTMPFALGVTLWLALCASLIGVIRRRRPSVLVFALAAFGASWIGMHSIAAPVWKVVPGAAFIQFPWRLLIPTTFWACYAGGIAAGRLAAGVDWQRPIPRIAFVAAMAIIGISEAPFLAPLSFISKPNAYSPLSQIHIMTDTMTGEYVPKGMHNPPPVISQRRIVWASGEGESTLNHSGSADYGFVMKVNSPGLAVFDVFWFPGWKVRVDGREVATEPVTDAGLVGWDMPAGIHLVDVYFGRTQLRLGAEIVSIIAALALIFVGWFPRRVLLGINAASS